MFRHIVLFQFKSTASTEEITAVEAAFDKLPAAIPEITAYERGPSESVEGRNDGFTHCFLVTFADQSGLETYIPHPAHVAFKEILMPVLEKALVYDYTARSN